MRLITKTIIELLGENSILMEMKQCHLLQIINCMITYNLYCYTGIIKQYGRYERGKYENLSASNMKSINLHILCGIGPNIKNF